MESARSARTRQACVRPERQQLGIAGSKEGSTAIIPDDVDNALAPAGGGLMVQRFYRRNDARGMSDRSDASHLNGIGCDSFS
jgi:hypothetical protein